MTDDTKLIFITSNADLIEQIQSNPASKTRIIDLDNNTNPMDLTFLAQFFQPNGKTDQIYKRALHSERDEQSKRRKKWCAVCGDDAVGYNYDVLSCASCKVFFHRWANSNLNDIDCLGRKDQCSVSHEIRRKCQKCRLRKCFEVGMRKDFLLNNKEKQRKTSVLPPTSKVRFLFEKNSLEILSEEDWANIENIQSSFLSIFTNNLTNTYSENISDRISALILWSHIANEIVLSFIRFFRSVDQFENLNNDDRFLLIKYNLANLFPILKSYYSNSADSLFSSPNSADERKRLQFYQLCFGSPNQNLIAHFANLVQFLAQIIDQDSIIASLLLLILLFSQGLAVDGDASLLSDPSTVQQIQASYINLLWRYLISKHGQIESIKRFNQLIRGILRLQLLSRTFRQYLSDQFVSKTDAEQLAPLVQTVLRIANE